MLPHPLCKEVRLEIVGEGPLRKDLEIALKKWNLCSQVCLLGLMPQGKIVEKMRKARCFVQHSMVAPDGDSVRALLLRYWRRSCVVFLLLPLVMQAFLRW